MLDECKGGWNYKGGYMRRQYAISATQTNKIYLPAYLLNYLKPDSPLPIHRRCFLQAGAPCRTQRLAAADDVMVETYYYGRRSLVMAAHL